MGRPGILESPETRLSTGRGTALMQVNFYAFIQECLVQTLEQDQGTGE